MVRVEFELPCIQILVNCLLFARPYTENEANSRRFSAVNKSVFPALFIYYFLASSPKYNEQRRLMEFAIFSGCLFSGILCLGRHVNDSKRHSIT